jgi:hypothetical protein
VTLALGESKTCKIINDDIAPSLHLRKTVTNNDGGTALATDWTLSAAGPTPISGSTPVDSGPTFSAGTYALSESGPANYTASAWSCVKNGGAPVTGASITLGLADSATCTINNDDNDATLVTTIYNADTGSPIVAASASAGTKVNDMGTVAKTAGTPASTPPPTGTVTFTFYRGGYCSTGTPDVDVPADTVALVSGVAYPSKTRVDPVNPALGLSGGQYAFKAHYSGDSNYPAKDSDCEPLDIVPKTSDIGTELHNADHSVIPPAANEATTATVHDKAIVTTTSGFAPTGTVTFQFFTNGECKAPPAGESTVGLQTANPSGGTVDNTGFPPGPLAAGTYGFWAKYNGDLNNKATDFSGCEPFMVTTITINKLANGGNDTFGYTVSGPTPSTPNILTTGTPGTGTTGAIVVLSGTYTVGETTIPAGWVPVGLNCGAGPEPPPTSAPFLVPAGTNRTCDFENTKMGATRTQGFWATHVYFANLVWATLVPDSEKNLCGTKDIHVGINPLPEGNGQNRLMGGFWANIPKKTNGAARTDADKARMQVLQQLLAALENKYGLGTADGGLIASAKAAYCNPDSPANTKLIKSFIGQLGAFNQSGDTIALGYPQPVAKPQAAQNMADKAFWDTTK